MSVRNQQAADQSCGLSRREFIGTVSKATGVVILLSPLTSFAGEEEQLTVGMIMDLFIKEVPGAPFEKTVDTLKSGSRDIKVKGIVTTMFATIEVIEKAIGLGANFIIAHEPTFYNHLDETEWLKHDEVYKYKKALLEKHQIAIWRNHDYIHRHQPDGVFDGVLKQLGWKSFYDSNSHVVTIPPLNLKNFITHVKTKLGIDTVRYIGDLSMVCKRVLLMPGAAGGKRQIELAGITKPDVILCGEVQEWETAEYIRDARKKGQNISLVVMGHVDSEEGGSEFMEKWLKERLPIIKTYHVPSKNPFSFA